MKSLDEYESFEEIERDISQAEEYRELVKQYAGLLFATKVNLTCPEFFPKIRVDMIKHAHALAKAVLESLENKEKAE